MRSPIELPAGVKMTNGTRLDDKAARTIMDVLVHDINNHIHGATGYLELTEHVMGEDPTTKRFLRNAMSELRSVSNLVENMGTLIRLPAEPFVGEPVDLYSQLMTAKEMALQKVEGKRLDLQTTLKHGDVVLNADRFLNNALVEVLTNSLKYDPKDPVVVWVVAEVEGGRAVIVIGDQGIGIPDDRKEGLLDRFWRSIENDDIHGKGMGLSVVKMVADRYGGSVSLSNRVMEDPGQGTKVTLELPLHMT